MSEKRNIPYRCGIEIHDKLKALSKMTGLSIQRIIDDLVEELLWKFQTESPYFKELSSHKQAVFVVSDIVIKAPVYKRFFSVFGAKKDERSDTRT